MNEPAPPPPPFKDRSTGLTVFGILTIFLGVIVALFVPLILWSQSMAAQNPGFRDVRGMNLAVAMYAALAVVLIWLGIGSIMARRWARALLVILSWAGLLTGVISMISMLLLLPQSMANSATLAGSNPSPAVTGAIMAVAMAFLAVILLAIPGLWAFFYSSRHVRATCEYRDPRRRWTDECPLPVLGLSLWAAFCVPCMLLMPLSGLAVLPLFGVFLTGLPANVAFVVLALGWGWLAWALYKLDPRAWWALLVVVLLFAISSAITYSRNDIFELYQLMDYSPAQIEEIKKYSFSPAILTWGSVIWLVPILGYLFYVRRFFHKGAVSQ